MEEGWDLNHPELLGARAGSKWIQMWGCRLPTNLCCPPLLWVAGGEKLNKNLLPTCASVLHFRYNPKVTRGSSRNHKKLYGKP